MTEEYIATQEYIDEIYEKDAIGRVQMNISVKPEEVPALVRAIKSYFEGLKESPVRPEEAHEVDEVFVAGGWAYIVKWREGEVPSIILESGGEDTISSIGIAAENLMEEILPVCLGARIDYEELPVGLAID
ncbi:hypothetical protein [uncultured Rothia sp.]|uniref:hypothetical protein n=1 Tax=uncultured Rothia sp. TaxID=316088 RepID=UPI003216C2FB